MAKKYTHPMQVRYLGGLSGDAAVSDAEKGRTTTFMNGKSDDYVKWGIETLSNGAIWIVIKFRDEDEKKEWRTLVWDTAARRTATNGTQPFKNKPDGHDGPGHPSHFDDAVTEILNIEE